MEKNITALVFKPGQSILYVEDELELSENVAEFFAMYGLHVVLADDSAIAIQKTLNEKFDLMLFDIHLKKSTGDHVIAKIRANQNNVNCKVPIVVISSHIDGPLIIKLKDLIQGAIVKPFLVNELLVKISRFLRTE